MNNRELAGTLTLVANLLEIKGEVIYTPPAYRKAAESPVSLAGDVRTGRLTYLEQLEKDVPAGLAEWLQVSGLRPKKVALIWKALGITTL